MTAFGFPNRTAPNLTNFLQYLFKGGYSLSVLGARQANTWYVDSTNGNNNRDGRSPDTAFATITQALTKAVAGDFIFVAPGQYDESPTLTRTTHNNVTIVGLGGRGAAFIQPTTEDANGLTCHADDVTIVNLGCAGEDTTSAAALTVTGSRFRAYGCKFEQGLDQLVIGPGTVAQVSAGTEGKAGDCLFDDCEFAWGTNGVNITCTDYGGATQIFFQNCRFHNLTASSFKETVGSGGSAAVMYFNLQIWNCIFDAAEDGTVPTKWLSLNGNNANTGVVSGCRFPTAINSGKNLVSTKLIWTGNFHTGGISAAQPS